MKYLTANLITFHSLLILSWFFFTVSMKENILSEKLCDGKLFPSPHRQEERKAIGQSRSCAKADDEKRWKNWEAACGWQKQRRCERTCRCSSYRINFHLHNAQRKLINLCRLMQEAGIILKLIWEFETDANDGNIHSDCPYDSVSG